MKKKIHSIVCVVIVSFVIYGLVNLLMTAGTAQKWETMVDRFGGEKIKNAKAFVLQYHRSGIKGLKGRFHPNLLPQLEKIEAIPIMQYFFKYKPQTIRSIDYQTQQNSTEAYRKYAFQLDFSELPPVPLFSFFQNDFLQTKGPYSLVLTLDELEKDNKTQLINFSIDGLSLEQKKMDDFRLSEKSSLHIAFLIASILVPIFIIFSLIQFVRMPEPCQKTLWFGLIAVGLAEFTFNWTTGDISYAFVYVALLGAGVNKLGMYAPWMISVSIPVGALLFCFKRKKWLAEYQAGFRSGQP